MSTTQTNAQEDFSDALIVRQVDDFVVDVDGYEGPLDVLLNLAKTQKVDITQISILQLANQYLAFIEKVQARNLELAADYLVMAAWLAYLKSRLLLPAPPGDEEPSGAEMAAMLAFQLQRLEAMKEAGARLLARPRLGRDFLARGNPELVESGTNSVFEVTLYDLLRAYAVQQGKQEASTLRIAPTDLYSIEDAVRRLRGLIGDLPDWTMLSGFLPVGLRDELLMRSAIASTFVASLELARLGQVELRQSDPFSVVYVRRIRSAG
jgi:segregation and condensation protein A